MGLKGRNFFYQLFYHSRHLNNELCDAVSSFGDRNEDDRSFAEERDGRVSAVQGPHRIAEVVDELDVRLHHGHQRRQLVLITVSTVNRFSGFRQNEEMFRLTSPGGVVARLLLLWRKNEIYNLFQHFPF